MEGNEGKVVSNEKVALDRKRGRVNQQCKSSDMPNMEHLTQAREPCEEHRLIRIAIIIDKAEVDTSGQRARSAGDHVSRADQGGRGEKLLPRSKVAALPGFTCTELVSARAGGG